MNPAHLHLLTNHVPVMGTIFGFILLGVAVMLRKTDVARSGLLVLALAAVVAVPAYLSGEPAEEIAEGLPGVAHAIVEEHEEAALPAFIAMEVAGALALVGLVVWRRAEKMPGAYLAAMLIVTLVAAIAIGRTALLGGEIRHTEIRAGAAAVSGESEE